jgi:transposase
MSRKGKIPGNERIAAVETYLRGEDSLRHLAKGLNVSCRAVKQWLQTYQSLGPAGLVSNYVRNFHRVSKWFKPPGGSPKFVQG